VAVGAVSSEPVSHANFPITPDLPGKSQESREISHPFGHKLKSRARIHRNLPIEILVLFSQYGVPPLDVAA